MAFFVGEKLPLEVEIRKDGALQDPASITVTIYANGTAKVTDAAMTQDSTGKYHYDITFDEAGRWTAYIKVTDASGRTQMDIYTFYVSEGRK